LVWLKYCSGFWTGAIRENTEQRIDLKKTFQRMKERGYVVHYDPSTPPAAMIVKQKGISITLHPSGKMSICSSAGAKKLIETIGLLQKETILFEQRKSRIGLL